jgi:hypothetical protein
MRSLPSSIQWMPAGEYRCNRALTYKPRLNDSGKRIGFEDVPTKQTTKHTIIITQRTCQALSDAIQAYRREGNCCFIDVNHDWSKRAAVVRCAYWGGEGPMTGGIRLGVDWTDVGRKALFVDGCRRFSPEYTYFIGNPERIDISQSLGGLTAHPANKNIAPVVASSLKDFRRYISVERDGKVYEFLVSEGGPR